jgi:hypothetical protein
MTTKTTPTRRTLATKPTPAEAELSAIGWGRDLGPDADVQVEANTGRDADTRPYAVTAKRVGGERG